MRTAFWESVAAEGFRVPEDAALDELTAELVSMLGDPDPHVRDELGATMLSTWVAEGIYDELLSGLGDGLAMGLRSRLGENGTDSVLRRSYSAAVLTAVVARDNAVGLLHPTTVLTWADRGVAWLLGERDLRGFVPQRGWAHAAAHGADLLGTLAASRHLGADELAVLLDVVADRLLAATPHRLVDGEPDRLAFATMSLLHRDLVTGDVVEPWVDRLTDGWSGANRPQPGQRVTPVCQNTVGFVRALHLQLLLGVVSTPTHDTAGTLLGNPALRGDLLIALQRALRTSAPWMYRSG
ncbi:MAG TPA: DUF2785 domain-containing protein [Jiangellales bacterium]|nr:DUF2785 domain-containing protein [Jiangellales bacterium]